MDNNKFESKARYIRKISQNEDGCFKNKKVLNKRKIVCFFIVAIVSITFLLPLKINAFTGEKHLDLVYINFMKFTFPNIKLVSSKETGGIMELLWDFKNKGKQEILKNEVSFLKNQEQKVSSEVFNNCNDTKTKDEKSSNKDNEFFNLKEDSIHKFKDNIKDKEIITEEGKNFKNSPYKNKEKSKKPQVLIYHTHTHEGFVPAKARTSNTKYNICAPGDILAETLEKDFNINVIHDKTVHDNNYTYCYPKSGQTLDKYLKTYGDFDLIIDLHRDSLESLAAKKAVTCKINGENAARFMFVMTTTNPYYKDQKKTVDKILDITNKNYPGLVRGNGIYPYKRGKNYYYSQNKSKHSFLIEMGSNLNTIDEAKTTCKYLGRVMAEYLKTKNE
ncbi:hypothetical protein C3495_08290 [Clostridiaceae bacterium 14S0207]|nr:hypothetical protein C3495_08290 [Clostridiaceae bacterium 14S0207]